MRKFLDEVENTAAKIADAAKDVCAKTDDRIERLAKDAQAAYARAAESLREKLNTEQLCEEPPKPQTLDDLLDEDVDAQINKIRAAQQTPGAFSDYIAKKYGKDKQ